MLRIAPASWKFSLSCVTFFTFLVSAQLGNSSVGCPASNYSTTLTSSGLIFFISCDTDREGGDLTSQPAASLNECLTLCEADPQCKSASWVQGVGTEISICYEKSAFFPNFWSPGVDMVTCLNCEFALPAQTVTAILTTTLTITDFTTLDLSTVTETAVSIHTITLAITLDASTIRETAVSTVISSAPPGTITATEVQISTLISTLLSIQPGAIVTSFIPGPTVTSVSTSISTVTITIIQVSTVIPSQAPAIATSFVPGPNLTFVSSSIVPRPTVTATAVQISTAAPSEAPATTSISMCYLYGLSNISTSSLSLCRLKSVQLVLEDRFSRLVPPTSRQPFLLLPHFQKTSETLSTNSSVSSAEKPSITSSAVPSLNPTVFVNSSCAELASSLTLLSTPLSNTSLETASAAGFSAVTPVELLNSTTSPTTLSLVTTLESISTVSVIPIPSERSASSTNTIASTTTIISLSIPVFVDSSSAELASSPTPLSTALPSASFETALTMAASETSVELSNLTISSTESLLVSTLLTISAISSNFISYLDSTPLTGTNSPATLTPTTLPIPTIIISSGVELASSPTSLSTVPANASLGIMVTSASSKSLIKLSSPTPSIVSPYLNTLETINTVSGGSPSSPSFTSIVGTSSNIETGATITVSNPSASQFTIPEPSVSQPITFVSITSPSTTLPLIFSSLSPTLSLTFPTPPSNLTLPTPTSSTNLIFPTPIPSTPSLPVTCPAWNSTLYTDPETHTTCLVFCNSTLPSHILEPTFDACIALSAQTSRCAGVAYVPATDSCTLRPRINGTLGELAGGLVWVNTWHCDWLDVPA
ncbi:hypothetical protein K432DRAFT_396465 [Lepidopterella palustris CBS 459.81]|uniref:Apple domain-containing protein n=1 Tax=Lepidopterella palustris CBS 459.81 TaxID=1314670 RepID=A0A8E2JBJ8_9PEZI|nr:hypothetical protein K432DRAFT_396465 [Lepidopterella palustris CBS 459.81]